MSASPLLSDETWPTVLEQQRTTKRLALRYSRTLIDPDEVILHELLGEGASGSVYFATYSSTPVAVKVISKKQCENPITLRRLKRETKIMSQMQHPNICQLYGKVKTDSHRCLVMQLAQHGDLLERLRRHGAMSENESRRLFIQLVSALSHMHSKGFVHRDIKPENLFLDADDNLLLGDFGFANSWSPARFQNDFCGSLHYAAPEVVSHKLFHGPEADVWSCGAVLLALATARLPFEGNDHAQLVRHVKTGRFIKSSKVTSRAMLDLLSRMMEPDQDKRITLKQVMKHPWVLIGLAQQEQVKADVQPMAVQNPNVRFNVAIELEGDCSDSEDNSTTKHRYVSARKDSNDAMDVSPKLERKHKHPRERRMLFAREC